MPLRKVHRARGPIAFPHRLREGEMQSSLPGVLLHSQLRNARHWPPSRPARPKRRTGVDSGKEPNPVARVSLLIPDLRSLTSPSC